MIDLFFIFKLMPYFAVVKAVFSEFAEYEIYFQQISNSQV